MSKLKLEVLFNAVDKVSGPIKTIIGGSKTMADVLKKTNSELKGFEATQRKIDSFRQLQNKLDLTSDKLAKYRNEHKLLKEQSKLSELTEDQTKKLFNLEQGIRRLKSVQKGTTNEMSGLTRELYASGINMERLGQSESDLKNKIHLTTMELNKQKEALGKHTEAQKKYEKMQERMGKANEMAKKGLMIAGAGAAALAVPVKLSIDFESAMADVKKVVDFDTPQQFKQMENDIISMSTRLPMAAKDIAAIYAAGGQSGIAKNELSQFAESAIKMGVAFDISAEEAGASMAEMRAAFKFTQPQVEALANQINYLSNNSTQSAKKITEVVQRVGSIGEIAGFAASDLAAMSATLTAIEPEVAATGLKNLTLALVKGESATKSQKAAFKSLGLDYKKISKGMVTDAQGTMIEVIQSLGNISDASRLATVNDLFGSEGLAVIGQMYNNVDKLKSNLKDMGDTTKYGTSMWDEYASRAATTANNIQLAKNQMAALGITIGNVLLPGVNSMIGSFNGVMSSVQKWAQANPGLASGLVKVAIGAIAIVGGLSALSIGLITIFGPMMMVGRAFGAVALAAKGMSMALLTNPITWIVLAIAGAALLIYKNWAPISAFFVGIWNTIKTAFNGGITGISALIINWSPIGLFYSAFAKVLSWFGVDLPAKFTGFGAMILEGLKNGILSKVNAVKDAITGAVSGVIDKARGILGIHSPSRVFMGIGDYTMQGMANGIANANGLPIAATSTATQGVVNTAAQTKPVKPINVGRNNPRSFVSQDTIEVHIHVKDGSVVKGTAEAMRQELRRVALEEQNARRKFLTDSE